MTTPSKPQVRTPPDVDGDGRDAVWLRAAAIVDSVEAYGARQIFSTEVRNATADAIAEALRSVAEEAARVATERERGEMVELAEEAAGDEWRHKRDAKEALLWFARLITARSGERARSRGTRTT